VSSYGLNLFGGFELTDGQGSTIAIRSKKGRCLLAYLALAQGQQKPRDELAALLWGDRGDSQARRSLSQELYRLRGLFPEEVQDGFVLEAESVGLDDSLFEVDIVNFERSLESGDAEAAALYTGELLAGLEANQEGFDDWLRGERERLRMRAVAALHERVRADHDDAPESANRLLALDPANEAAHRALMQLHANAGRRDLALKQYDKCREDLTRELGIEPDGETKALYEQIKADAPAAEPSSDKITHDGAPALPSKPSIAVLPFNNMSGDAAQDHFADVLTEDITTALSRYRDLFVISSHSAFAFKGKAGDVREIARELGVRYILEGSVRWAGGRVRIGPQLIDADTGGHVWAERFDGKTEDIFDLQDELTAKTAAAVGSGILAAEIDLAKRQRPGNLDAYGLYAQGLGHWMDINRTGLIKAKKSFSEAIDLDPRFSNAHACLGWVHNLESVFGWAEDPQLSQQKSFEASRRAVELDLNNETAHAFLAFALLFRGEHEMAAAEAEHALDLNPNLAFGYCVRSFVNVFSGRHQEGLADGRAAIRLSPRDSFLVGSENIVAFGAYLAGDYETSVEASSAMAAKYPDFLFGHVILAMACAQLGQIERANKALEEALRVSPNLIDTIKFQPLKEPADAEHYVDGLRKAGLDV